MICKRLLCLEYYSILVDQEISFELNYGDADILLFFDDVKREFQSFELKSECDLSKSKYKCMFRILISFHSKSYY